MWSHVLFQAMNSFSAALASGQLGPLMNQFNLGEDVANASAKGGMFTWQSYHVWCPLIVLEMTSVTRSVTYLHQNIGFIHFM